jgi:hypothetical protein
MRVSPSSRKSSIAVCAIRHLVRARDRG